MLAACALAIVLLMDTSGSYTDAQYATQRDGTSAAFTSEQILGAVRHSGGIAVTVIEFDNQVVTRIGWRILNDEADSRRLASDISALPRQRKDGTSTGDGMAVALHALQNPPCEPDSRMIDISTDGRGFGTVQPSSVRDSAAAQRVRINAIMINTAHGDGDTEWLRENVLTPMIPGTDTQAAIAPGFLIEIRSWNDYTDAIRRKLILELADARHGTAPLP